MSQRHSPREIATTFAMFLLTLLSMLWVGAQNEGVDPLQLGLGSILAGAHFALPLLAILTAHEFGHYLAARIHGVDTSLPLFIPMPYSLIGTFGAVIRMSRRITSRNALLDIGAAGPLSGLMVALPVLVYGLSTSEVKPIDPGAAMEGRSLLYLGVLYAVHGSIPAGHDVFLNATAFAGWAGLLVTMMNLVPTGQLDGGHVAFALFGPRQDRYGPRVRRGLFWCAVAIVLFHASGSGPLHLSADGLGEAVSKGGHWLMWWAVLTLMARLTGEAHPPTEAGELSPGRRRVAAFTLLLFVLLFMPTWLSAGAGSDGPTTLPADLAEHATPAP